jgi:hypothetical protein
MLLFVTVENKKCLNGSQIGQIEKKLFCWRSTRREKPLKVALSVKIVNFYYPYKLSDMIDALLKRVSVTYKCYEMYAHRGKKGATARVLKLIKKWTPSW